MDREQALAAAKAAISAREAPRKVGGNPWGEDVYVKPPSWAESLRLRKAHEGDDAERQSARTLAAALCSANGVSLLDPGNEDDVDLILGQGLDFVNAVTAALNDTAGKGSAQTTSS